MYSTKLKDDRYLVGCVIISDDISCERFIVDTGAKYSCCSYSVIGGKLREEPLIHNEIKYLGGLVKGMPVKFYKYRLKQFTIGNIDMGEQSIWITFDNRVTDIILGMDILKQIIVIANPYDQRMYFCKDSNDYESNFRLMAY